MSFTLIDYFNGFQSLKAKKKFSAGAQSTYFAILGKFNSAHYPATLSISTRDLKNDAGLKSVATAHECRNVLKNNKLIDFQSEKGTTVYRLLTEHLPNRSMGFAEQQPNANQTAEGLLNLPAHGEVEMIDRDDDDASARKVETAREPQATVTRPKPLSSPKSDANEIQSVWQQSFGFALFGDNALTLEQLAAEDFARAELAIKKTAARNLTTTNPTAVLAYFRKVYESTPPTPQQTPKTKKTSFEDQFDWDAIEAQFKLTGGK